MIKRSWLSISRKRSKTFILGVLMFVIANLVLATIFIKNATNESMKYAKSNLGSEVYLQADMEKLMSERENSENSNEEERQMIRIDRPEIYIETVKTLADSSYVKDYTYSISSSATAVNFEAIESSENNRPGFGGMTNEMGDIQIEGINAYAYINGVQNKTITLSEGTYFDESTNNKIIISYELAEQNSLTVGNKIILKNNSKNEEIELEIIGIYSTTESDDNRSFINSSNRIYMNVETASKFLSEEDYNNGNYSVNNVTYYLNDPETSDAFIKEANSKVPTLEENNLKLDINNNAYESMIEPIESVGSFATTILVIVVLASIVIISLLINNQIKDRKYEIGVLMALGETKKNIIIQILFELIIVSAVAFALSTLTSLFVADKMAGSLLENQIKMSEEQSNNNFGRPGFNAGGPNFNKNGINKQSSNIEVIDQINVVSSFSDYIISFGLGFVIILASMILPTYNIIKYEPKTILTRRD